MKWSRSNRFPTVLALRPHYSYLKIGDDIFKFFYDISNLKKENPDVIGWIIIPGTEIDYPVLFGENNSYYLNRTWNKKISYIGSIFVDYRVSLDFKDDMSIIYGHNLKNKDMFSVLLKYKDESFLRQHKKLYVSGGNFIVEYEVTNARKENVGADIFKLKVKSNPEMLVLSTCTGDGHDTRWIVICKKIRGYFNIGV